MVVILGLKTAFAIGPKKVVVIRNSEVVVFVKLFYKEHGKSFWTFRSGPKSEVVV